MKHIKIKRIFTADFRKSPRTLMNEIKSNQKLWCGRIEQNEAYVFLSIKGSQILFVLNDSYVKTKKGTKFEKKQNLLDFRAWRIESSTFDPMMLEDYANAVGLTLGKKTFVEQWEDRHG